MARRGWAEAELGARRVVSCAFAPAANVACIQGLLLPVPWLADVARSAMQHSPRVEPGPWPLHCASATEREVMM